MGTILKEKRIKLLLLIVVLGLVFFFFGENAGMLVFNIFWQIMVAIALVDAFKVNRVIKKGIAAKGTLVKFEKRNESGDDDFFYQGDVEFYFPERGSSYVVSGRLAKVDESKEYVVYVNEANPSKSVIADSIKGNRGSSGLILYIIFILLFYVDYILIRKL